ncbi:MAG: biotin synthase BioB [Thiotrichales bacterium]|nr:MAG: biotin synthase BioB [Thiotrichales bacterium]
MLRNDWNQQEITDIYMQPLQELMFTAHKTHLLHFKTNSVQPSTLFSIKTGSCPEDCGYCSQSGHNNTNLLKQRLTDIDTVIERAKEAKAKGAARFCMGAGWRTPPTKEMGKLCEMVKQVKALGLEVCMTLGMLDKEKAEQLKVAGLDYYNHNLDTSPEYYKKIITTRTYDDRLNTLEHVRNVGMKTCCGGIVSMGETRVDRIQLLQQLANLPKHPESVPINHLVPIKGTPLGNVKPMDKFEFVRTIATARIIMPQSVVRLSAGRSNMSEELQALCYFCGANSIFYGEELLTTQNSTCDKDKELMQKLGMSFSSNVFLEKQSATA